MDAIGKELSEFHKQLAEHDRLSADLDQRRSDLEDFRQTLDVRASWDEPKEQVLTLFVVVLHQAAEERP